MRLALLAVILAVFPAAAVASTTLERATARIATRAGADVVLQVEVVRTRAERRKGLMYRRSLQAKSGMVFVYPQPVRGGFWMKNTLIPLDIAFYDAAGKILRILTMTPCRTDPCRIYEPGVAYRAALEVSAGSFRRWQVKAGDRITIRLASRSA